MTSIRMATRVVVLVATAWLAPALHMEKASLFDQPPVKSILFVGDSTMRAQFYSMCRGPVRNSDGHFLWCSLNGANVYFMGWSLGTGEGHLFALNESVYQGPNVAARVLEDLTGMRPEILYANFMGMHQLHLMPVRGWQLPSDRFHYTAEHICQTFANAFRAGVKKLVLMSSHKVCEEKYTGSWKTIAGDRFKTHCVCNEWVNHGCPGIEVGDGWGPCPSCGSDMKTLCVQSTFTFDGANHLAEVERDAVHMCQAQGIPLKLVDANMITDGAGCGSTHDGRHYVPKVVHQEVEAFEAAVGIDAQTLGEYREDYNIYSDDLDDRGHFNKGLEAFSKTLKC